ncbi:MAG: hypothetical protein AAF717_01710 [Bacteroidota bacterium]
MRHIFKSLWVLIGLICFIVSAQEDVKTSERTMAFDLPVEMVELNGVALNLVEGLGLRHLDNLDLGMYLILKTPETQEVIYINLGPAWAVSIWTEGIEGQPVKLIAFRTEKLPEHHFIAKELEWDGQKAVFRDGYLKPFWADRHEKEIW